MSVNRWCAAVAAVMALGVAAGCGGNSDDGGEEGAAATAKQDGARLAFFVPVLGNEFGSAYQKGIEAAAKANGASLQTFDSQGDPGKQLSQIQDAVVADRFDGFIIYTDDGVNVVPGVERALDAGIKVSAVDTVIGPDRNTLAPYKGMTTMVGQTGADNGAKIAEQIVDACGDAGQETCEVLVMIGSAKYSIDRDRLEVVKEELAKHPNIKIVATQEANYERDRGRSVMQDALQSHPDLDVVATWGDQMALGAIPAIADAGKQDQIKVLGNGASAPGAEAIKDGSMYSAYAFLPETAGKIVTEETLNAIAGKEVRPSVNMEEQSPPLPESGVIINSSNVDEFHPEW